MKIQVWLKGTGGLTTDQINFPSTPEEVALAERVRASLFRKYDPVRDVGLYELALTYDDPDGPYPADDDTAILEWVFEQGNIGETTRFAVEYRAARNRSISVGDVVVIDDRTYACASAGWTPLEYLPEEARREVNA